ncbi:MAG: dihydroneopterin aldolase [Defluviimonas sp.]|uniref:dihydroneopterin aldolase n=1 Tax=Albidovulum sp. TaxID=1872424 RepID=UPI001E08467D|nr:dihydroneopterin aldolase [Paracoccaceae bacterium]MCC0065199.1 dihydroneopterin aldolase [Defluviimonas sp.]
MTDTRATALQAAFGPLEARACAAPPDRLSLRDHVVSAEIGAFQEERGQAQRLRVSIVVELAAPQGAGDDVDGILSYDRLTEAIDRTLASARYDLVETLAEGIAARVLRAPQAERVFVRVEKLDRGPGALGVEIVRTRQAGEPLPPEPGRAPAILLADPAEPLAPALAAIAPGALVILPALPATERPAARGMAARRIALLEIEQAAWALLATAPDLSVVASRTELDWALAQGRRVLWAPGKLVLDTPGAPETAEGPELAAWIVSELGAGQLYLHGSVAVPAACRVPVTRL